MSENAFFNLQNGFRTKIKVLDYDPHNSDDLIDEIGYNFMDSDYQPSASLGSVSEWKEIILDGGRGHAM